MDLIGQISVKGQLLWITMLYLESAQLIFSSDDLASTLFTTDNPSGLIHVNETAYILDFLNMFTFCSLTGL